MPRGSKPSERRGGRQKGTPNKKTVLKNALIGAAASGPNTSPLDFMLGLMRDPKVPTDLRLDMAVAAAPFVHAKPQAPPRVRTNPMDSGPIKGLPDFTPPKMEEKLSAPEQSGESGAVMSPLQFLLSVMKDPDATPQQRMKAARVAARYAHAAVPPDKLAAVDEYGFAISRTLAKAIADDWLRLSLLHSRRSAETKSNNHIKEASEIYARQAQRDEFLQCPEGYSTEQDQKRLAVLHQKSWRCELSMAEETELAYVVARIVASGASERRTPEGRARSRIEELEARVLMRIFGRIKPSGLTPEEQSEIDQLSEKFPSLKRPEPTPLDVKWRDHFNVR